MRYRRSFLSSRRSESDRSRIALVRVAAATLLVTLFAACSSGGGLVDLVPEDETEDPSDMGSLATAITDVIDDFTLALDNYARYSGLLIDEFVLAGTFSGRREVDERAIDSDNSVLTDDLYVPIHRARFSADFLAAAAESLIGDANQDQDVVDEAIVVGQLYGGYVRVLLAELYCQSILGGGDSTALVFEAEPLSPDARMSDALDLLQAAEANAAASGFADLAQAARVAQARAHMWLEEYSQAASVAASVDPDFLFESEYSSADPARYNDVYAYTYGDFQVIRWTVGDGLQPERNLERFAFYEEWADLGLIEPEPGQAFAALDPAIQVHLQLIYGQGQDPPAAVGQAASILLGSGFEADIMEAEAAYRTGDRPLAAQIVNSRLTDPSANPHEKEFSPVSFTGNLALDLAEIGRAYSAGTWLTGHRFGFMRRVLRNDGVDLFPSAQPGRDTAFPVVKLELDNNDGIGQACPSGPPWN